jgi:hypothetical protein
MLGSLGTGPEPDVSLAGLVQRRATGAASDRVAPQVIRRDLSQDGRLDELAADLVETPGLPRLSELLHDGCDRDSRDSIRVVGEVLDRHGDRERPPPGQGDAAPAAEASDSRRALITAALLRAHQGTGNEAIGLEAVTEALLDARFDEGERHGGAPATVNDPDARVARVAFSAWRALAGAGGSGPGIAVSLLPRAPYRDGGELAAALEAASDRVGQVTAPAVAASVMARAADVLDPTRTQSFASLRRSAEAVLQRTVPAPFRDRSEAGLSLSPGFTLDHLSSALDRRHDRGDAASATMLPAVAFLALIAPAERRPSEVERAAIHAVRNGLTDHHEGSDLAFSNGRISKLGTYAARVRGNLLSRLVHKNPLLPIVARGDARMPDSVLSVMRAIRNSASTMARIFDGLHALSPDGSHQAAATAATRPDADGSPIPATVAAYWAVVLEHWGKRYLTTQGLDQSPGPQTVERMRTSLRARLPDADPATRGYLEQRLAGQTLEPHALESLGWELVGALQASVRSAGATTAPIESAGTEGSGAAHRARERPSDDIAPPERIDPTERARAVVRMLAGLGRPARASEDGSTRRPQTDADLAAAASDVLRGLESSLLAMRISVASPSSDGPAGPGRTARRDGAGAPTHPEKARALAERGQRPAPSAGRAERASDPIGFLADCIGRFELGSSVTMSRGHLKGVNFPHGLVTSILSAFVPSPVQLTGRFASRERREAVLSASLSSSGGEIFVGTVAASECERAYGAAAGLPVVPGVLGVGVGGTISRRESDTRASGVYLRIPRSGEVIDEASGDDGRAHHAPAGLDGDHLVAARMATVLKRIAALTAVSPEQAAPGARHVVLRLLAEFPELSVGVVRGPDRQGESAPDIVRVDAAVGLVSPYVPAMTLAGAVVSVERAGAITRWRHEEGGHNRVTVKGEGDYSRLDAGARLAGLVPGSGLNLAAVRTPIAHGGVARSTTVARLDGSVAGSSFRTHTTPNLGTFRRRVDAALPGLVDFGLAVGGNEAAAGEREQARLRQASHLIAGTERIEHGAGKTYTVFSIIRPDARTALDNLAALESITEGAHRTSAVAGLANEAFARIAGSDDAFRPSFAFQTDDRMDEHQAGTRVLLEAQVRTAIRWTGVFRLA